MSWSKAPNGNQHWDKGTSSSVATERTVARARVREELFEKYPDIEERVEAVRQQVQRASHVKDQIGKLTTLRLVESIGDEPLDQSQ